MAKYRALTATENVDLQGQRFSPEALKQLEEQLPGQLVTLNFNRTIPVGVVRSAEVTERGLELVAELDDSVINDPASLYIVPGFIVNGTADQSASCEVFTDVKADDFGLTTQPADQSLTPIELITEDESL